MDTNVWPTVCQGYAHYNNFNENETGIFFKLTPEETFKFKGEKLFKDQVTVLLCANGDGTEKRKLLVIEKLKNPRCFKHVKNLPVRYNANKYSWMTSDLFTTEIRHRGRELPTQKAKIQLLVDNCPAHPVVEDLENIKLVFIPANTTSIIQPMDQGVIRSLKSHYCKLILLRLIECMEKKQDHTVTLLVAIRGIEKAWG